MNAPAIPITPSISTRNPCASIPSSRRLAAHVPAISEPPMTSPRTIVSTGNAPNVRKVALLASETSAEPAASVPVGLALGGVA